MDKYEPELSYWRCSWQEDSYFSLLAYYTMFERIFWSSQTHC